MASGTMPPQPSRQGNPANQPQSAVADTLRRPRSGILLANLGSPDSPAIPDVRRYLRQFLMDERVLDIAWWKRFLIVHLFILPFRPARTSEAYRQIWRPDGSPLIAISRQLLEAIQTRMPVPVALAMRYQNPSIESGLGELARQGVSDLLLAPLYPHYASSSFETVVACARTIAAKQFPQMAIRVLPPFYRHPAYIDALVASAKPHLDDTQAHWLLSFHGVPERHLRRSDTTGRHCLVAKDCCTTPHPAHATCYRAQCLATAAAFVQQAGLPPVRFTVAFQSRLGREPWLQPFTDHEIQRLARQGVRDLRILCPSFVTDCLETLEEIGMRGRALFLDNGGQSFSLVPCLNDHPAWIDALERILREAMTAP